MNDQLQWLVIVLLTLVMLGQGYLTLESVMAGWKAVVAVAKAILLTLKGGNK